MDALAPTESVIGKPTPEATNHSVSASLPSSTVVTGPPSTKYLVVPTLPE